MYINSHETRLTGYQWHRLHSPLKTFNVKGFWPHANLFNLFAIQSILADVTVQCISIKFNCRGQLRFLFEVQGRDLPMGAGTGIDPEPAVRQADALLELCRTQALPIALKQLF
jgi:hypothetical protein